MNFPQRLTSFLGFLLLVLFVLVVSLGGASGTAVVAAQNNDPLQIVVKYLNQNRAEYGLLNADLNDFIVTDMYETSDTGLTHIYLRQRVNGIEVWTGNLNANVMRDGTILSLNSAFVPNVNRASYTGQPALTAAQALQTAAQELNWAVTGSFTTQENLGGADQRQILSTGGISTEAIPAKLVYVVGEEGQLILAWELVVKQAHTDDWWQMAVDATTGAVVGQINWTVSHNAADIALSDARLPADPATQTLVQAPLSGTYRVFAFPYESPTDPGATHSLVATPHNATASPFGWHDTNGVVGAEFTDTRGNNAEAYTDWVDDSTPDASELAAETSPGVYDYTFNPAAEPQVGDNPKAAVVNLFYWNNITHDLLYMHGFDEASGNFQTNNYGRGGLGGDPVQAQAQDKANLGARNNANFGTPPDGQDPQMQMFLWNTTTPERDGDFDAGIIAHEYGHGWSTRLTGGPSNVGCLGNNEQMGEGWSDYLSVVFTAQASDTRTTTRGVGTYALGQPSTGTGIRPAPYTTDMGVNTFTYSNLGSMAIPHGVGFVWNTMLWEVYWNLVDEHGFNPDLYADWSTGGNNLALRLVTDGLKIQPCSPGFVDGRDAILAADVALTGGVNQCAIWAGFAKRGLGFGANQGSSASTTDGTAAFDMPSFCQGVNVVPASQTICAGTNATYNVIAGSSFAGNVDLSAAGNPAPTNINFTPNPVAAGEVSVLTVGNTAAVSAGNYTIAVLAQEGAVTSTFDANLTVVTTVPGTANLSTPANGAVDQPLKPTFTWSAVPNTVDYLLEVATDAAFNTVVYTTTVTTTSHQLSSNLEGNTPYFWRVMANNVCGAGTASAVFSFTTLSTTAVCPAGTTPEVAYQTDFESGATGWTHSGTGDTWALSGARPNSGTTAWFAVDSSSTSDQRLVSPAIIIPDLSQAPLTLEFANYQAFEQPDVDGRCWDAAILEVSTNGGSSWSKVPNSALITDPYDAIIWNDQAGNNPITTSYGATDAWCPNPPPQEYLNSIVNLTAYAGQTVNFRWRLGTDGAAGNEGWYVDDVKVQSCVPIPDTYGVELAATADQAGLPGATVTYTVAITNTGSTTDTFDIALTGQVWDTIASDANLMLGSGQSAEFTVAVTIDAGAVVTDTDTVTVMATSTTDGSATASADLTTSVTAVPPTGSGIFLPFIMKP